MNHRQTTSHRVYSKPVFLAVVLGAALFSGAGQAKAAPNVSSISGNLTPGSTVSVSGSGFGDRASASPFKWDDFEAYAEGEAITPYYRDHPPNHNTGDWFYYSDHTEQWAKSTTAQAHGGNKSIGTTSVAGSECWGNFFVGGFDSMEIFASCWYRYGYASGGSGNAVFKLITISGNGGGNENLVYLGLPRLRGQAVGNGFSLSANPYYLRDDGANSGELVANDVIHADTWIRLDSWVKLSSDTTGYVQEWYNQEINSKQGELNPQATLTMPATKLNTVMTPLAMATPWSGPFVMYLDDCYFDTTLARVEMCDSGAWSERSHCEIQIPSAWVNNSITLTANPGSFNNGDTAYLYVVDSTGAVNSIGYPVTLGSSQSDTTPPAQPTGLIVN